jgi:Family of unknown function (DUF5407)
MNRLPLTIGMVGAGLLIGVLSPAVATASTGDAGTAAASAANASSQPPIDVQKKKEGSLSPEALREMQATVNRLSQLSQMSTSVISSESAAVSQMAKNVKQ